MLVQPLTIEYFDNRIHSIGLIGLYFEIKLHLTPPLFRGFLS